MRIVRWLQRAWTDLRVAYLFVKPVRFVAIPLVALLWALIASNQGQDAVRSLVEINGEEPGYGRIALFLVATCLTALQVWYWARQLLRDDSVAPGADRHPRSERWVPRLFGASVFVIAVGALGKAWFLAWDGHDNQTIWVIVTTGAILGLLLAAFIAFVIYRRKLIGPSPRVTTYKDLDRVTLLILRGTVLVAALFVVWTAISPLTAGSMLSSPALLMVSVLLWVGLGSFLAHLFDSHKVPLVATFLVLAILFSLINDNHEVRTLEGSLPARKPVKEAFQDWYRRLAERYPDEKERAYPVFIVATEGGGIRAAYWTAAVLAALQDAAPRFADHLFAISSVSGGSLGSAVFTALVAGDACTAVAPTTCDTRHDGRFRKAAKDIFKYDSLAPALASLLHADFVQRFLPVGFIPDRGRALETGWERAWCQGGETSGAHDDRFADGMLKMYADVPAGALLPSLFLNGTSVEVGNRLIASNVAFTEDEIPDATDLFTEVGRDMRLSTAAHNSARFTYVSPAGAVHDVCGNLVEHVVDGGYFEDSGAATASDVLAAVQPLAQGAAVFHLILIKFDDLPPAADAGSPRCPPPRPRPSRFMDEVLSPLRALYAAHNAHATLAYSEVKKNAGAADPAKACQDIAAAKAGQSLAAAKVGPVQVHIFVLTEDPKGLRMPLGWLLSARTRNAIDLEVGSTEPTTLKGLDPKLLPAVQENFKNLEDVRASLAPCLPTQLSLPAPAPTPQVAIPAPPTIDEVQKDASDSEDAVKH